MKHKTSELEGALLDAAVAKAECLRDAGGWWARANGTYIGKLDYEPSDDWASGGPIIERERINLRACHGGGWSAQVFTDPGGLFPCYGYGPTPLIAAMRAFVASKLGAEVELP